MGQTEINIQIAGVRYHERRETTQTGLRVIVEPTDSQRSKLYKAERESLAPMSRIFTTERAVISFVEKTCNRAPIKRRYGQFLIYSKGSLKFRIYFNQYLRRVAQADEKGIELQTKAGNFSWSEWVILHELAHTITMRRDQRRSAGHGREFAAVYLDLVKFAMGRDASDALKKSFRAHKVRFTKKRNVVFSEEQKAEMRERMKIARAKLPTREAKPRIVIDFAEEDD